MNEETIKARLADLLKHREEVVAQLNVVAGAIQQCEWFLERLEPAKAEVPKFELVK